MIRLPKNIAIEISRNDHKTTYQPLGEWLRANLLGVDDWVSPKERDRALATDECWLAHWYPDSPVEFCILLASSQEALLAALAARSAETLTVYEACGLPEVRAGRKCFWYSISSPPGARMLVRHVSCGVESIVLMAPYGPDDAWRWSGWSLVPDLYDLPATLVDPEPAS